jgi:thymidylate synthase (FAD)
MERAELIEKAKIATNIDGQYGELSLVDVMGTDLDVVEAAKVSYARASRPMISDEVTLLRLLMRHRHSTPFEMVELKFRIVCPIFVVRQWHRHRTQSYNEESGRYSEMRNEMYQISPCDWRAQSTSNKQGSAGMISDEWPDDPESQFAESLAGYSKPCEYLSERQTDIHAEARKDYELRLKLGVAKEIARNELPVSTYTGFYAKANLRNWFHFLGLRRDGHAQLEIRRYADRIGEIISELFPISYKAWEDYDFNSMSLSAPEIQVVNLLLPGKVVDSAQIASILTKREIGEFKAKLVRLGLTDLVNRLS